MNHSGTVIRLIIVIVIFTVCFAGAFTVGRLLPDNKETEPTGTSQSSQQDKTKKEQISASASQSSGSIGSSSQNAPKQDKREDAAENSGDSLSSLPELSAREDVPVPGENPEISLSEETSLYFEIGNLI